MTTKATLYIDEKLYKAFKIKAAHTDQTLSELVADAMRAQLNEDLDDIKAIRERGDDPTESYEQFLEGLKRDGLI
jgi:phosphate uptake regulator